MKITKYILFFTMFFNFNLYGGSEKLVEKMNYEISYEQALKKAQKLNKPLMLVIGQKGCPYCMKFEVKTLTKKVIHDKVEKNFIPLSVLRNIDDFPKQFNPKGVPTVYFIEPKEQNIFYKSFGYKSKREFKNEIDKALEIFNKKHKH